MGESPLVPALDERTITSPTLRIVNNEGQPLLLRFEVGTNGQPGVQPLVAYNFPISPEVATDLGRALADAGQQRSHDLTVVRGPVDLDEVARKARAATGR